MSLVKKNIKGNYYMQNFFDNYFLMKQRIKIETENKIIKLKINKLFIFHIILFCIY